MKLIEKHLFLLMLILILVTLCLYEINIRYQTKDNKIEIVESNIVANEEISENLELQVEYEKCLSNSYLSVETVEEINSFLNKYNDFNYGIYFEDINNNYKILKNENSSFYAASLIKLFDATYLIEKSNNNEINLEETTITYTSKYIRAYSDNMQQHQLGDKVSLKDLISYILLTSDNSAHEMLFDYIGVNNLKNYGQSIGVNLSISDYDHFGYLTVTDTNKILAKIFDLIKLNNENSKLLKENMNNNYFNSLNFNDIEVLHKYGSYDPYFHDIGIYNDPEYPYYISIMTTINEQPSPNEITELHKEIKAIYDNNLQKKAEYCYKSIYN